MRGAQRQLQLLLSPEKVADYFLLHKIECTLDPESQTQWGMRRTANSLPTLEQMYDFLELRSSLLAALPRPANAPRQADEHRRGSTASGQNPTSMVNAGRGDEPQPKCDLCPDRYHWPFKCPKFRLMPISERTAYVIRRKMCLCCFSTKHIAANCSDRQCPRCHVRHNSCLCPHNPNAPKIPASSADAAGGAASGPSAPQ